MCLCLLAFGNVHVRANEFNKIAGRVEYRVRYRVDVLESPVRKNGSEIPLEVGPFTDCSVEDFARPGSILRVNALAKCFE